MSRLKILPLLVFVAMLAFTVRLADVVITGVPGLSGSAFAEAAPSQDELKPPTEEPAKEEAKAEEKSAEAKPDAEKTEEKTGGLVIEDDVNDKKPAAKTEEGDKAKETAAKDDEKESLDKEAGAVPLNDWKDAGDSDLAVDDVKIEMFADLSKRRDELDKREAVIVTKEALLKATEQELDRKYQELDRLRGEIKTLLGQQEEQESSRIGSLVKVYEGMKPQDAARIFDTLDLDILLAVMSRMSERKLSPVLAEMNSERAKTVTTMLAEQKQLPQLPEIPAAAPASN